MSIFDGSESEPKTLDGVIGQAIGAGSACWDNLVGAGKFESEKALAIVNEVVAWIGDHYTEDDPSKDSYEYEVRAFGREEPIRLVKVNMIRWFKNGDHPDDHVGEVIHDPLATDPENEFYERLEGAYVRFFRHPDHEFSGEKIHDDCSLAWHDHGWIDSGGDGVVVCPGDWLTL